MESEVQLGNALIFVKQSTRIFNCTKNMLKVPVKGIVQSILQIKQDTIVNNLKVSRNTTTQLILEMDGDFILQPDQHVRLHPRTGSSTMIGSRIKVGILGDLQPGLNSEIFVEKSFNKICIGEPVAG